MNNVKCDVACDPPCTHWTHPIRQTFEVLQPELLRMWPVAMIRHLWRTHELFIHSLIHSSRRCVGASMTGAALENAYNVHYCCLHSARCVRITCFLLRNFQNRFWWHSWLRSFVVVVFFCVFSGWVLRRTIRWVCLSQMMSFQIIHRQCFLTRVYHLPAQSRRFSGLEARDQWDSMEDRSQINEWMSRHFFHQLLAVCSFVNVTRQFHSFASIPNL